MRRVLFVCGAVILVLFGGCSNNPITPSSGVTYQISSRIDFSIVPNLTLGGLTLHAQTENSYAHSDFILEYRVYPGSNSFAISITDAYEPPTGSLSEPAPATADIYLGVLADGTYSLVDTINNYPQAMSLIVTDTSYEISNGTGSWTYIASSLINRIPAYTIWGSFSSGNASANLIANSFVDSLDTIGATARTFSPGDYAYFTVGSNGQIVDQNVTSIFHSAFAFVYHGDLALVKNLVLEYGTEYGSNILITVFAYDGEEFISTGSAAAPLTRPGSILSVRRQ